MNDTAVGQRWAGMTPFTLASGLTACQDRISSGPVTILHISLSRGLSHGDSALLITDSSLCSFVALVHILYVLFT